MKPETVEPPNQIASERDTGLPVSVGVSREITRRRREEEEFHKLNRTLQAVLNTQQALLHATDETALLERICAIITQDCGYAMMWIGFAEDDNDKTVRPVASAGFDEGYLGSAKITWADTERGRGSVGTAIRTGKPNACRDILTDPNWKPWREQAQKHGFASCISLPLLDRGKAFGAITIYSKELDAFTEDEGRLLSNLAEDLAYGIGALRMRAAHARAEEKVRKSQELLETFVAQAPVALAMLDRNMCYLQASNKWCQDKGVKREAIQGKSHYDIFPNLPEHWKEAHRRALAGESPQNEEDSVVYGGKTHTLRWKIHPWGDSGCETGGIIIFIEDITDRKRAEQEMHVLEHQSQKMEAIGQLAAGIAHEINTPIQYVGDNANFLKESWGPISNLLSIALQLRDELGKQNVTQDTQIKFDKCVEAADLEYMVGEIPRSIDQSLEGVQRVAKIVRAMKEFAHPGSEEKCAVDINRAIETTLTVARNEWKYVADVHTCLDTTLPAVPCYAGELNQVILNLLLNAVYAIADVVSSGASGKGMISITTTQVENTVEIRVQDTGTGIPENIRSRVFDPFFTTKDVGKGTGQGLALAHSVIVKKHGGKIWFESDTGKGTTFFIRLPLATGGA